jgi:hypothetical protein
MQLSNIIMEKNNEIEIDYLSDNDISGSGIFYGNSDEKSDELDDKLESGLFYKKSDYLDKKTSGGYNFASLNNLIKDSFMHFISDTNTSNDMKTLVQESFKDSLKETLKDYIRTPLKEMIQNPLTGYEKIPASDSEKYSSDILNDSSSPAASETTPGPTNTNLNQIITNPEEYKIPKLLQKIISTKRAFKDKEYDLKKNITLKKFSDLRPVSENNNEYFIKSKNFKSEEGKGIAVVIPFFNEPSHELQQTLFSLYNTWNYLRKTLPPWRDGVLYVCLIQDGWNKADPSMKEYLKALFPKKIKESGKYWWDHYPEFNSNQEHNKYPDQTFIFQKKKHGPVLINPQEVFAEEPKYMRISLVIKADNRRKHNSHEWFLGKKGFAESINAKYLFLTDAFTLYNKKCLTHLVSSLDNGKNVVAVTGRQRVMSKKQQGGSESFFSLGGMLRMVQAFDFESSNVIYNGAFSLLGGPLPVVPGPCGMYAAKNLLHDNVRNYYFDTVNADPDTTGMVLGNLRIAEDRILTYAAVTKSPNKNARMEFNTLAVFYFEAETDLRNFMFQRRRWINGSVAGYLYLLFFSFMDFVSWKAGLVKKIYIWILLMCQFLTYVMITVAPSVQIKILYTSIGFWLDYFDLNTQFDIKFVAAILWAIYFVHIFVHNKSKFNYIIIYVLLMLSILTSVLSLGSLAFYAFVVNHNTFLELVMSQNIVLYLALYVFIGPFIVSLALSGKGHSLLFMLKSFISYYLFLPMLVGWFASYSYSRAWDLSWGNRPTGELHTTSTEQRKSVITNFKDTNKVIIIIIAAINLILFFMPYDPQLYLMAAFFVLAAYQLTLSLIYCLSRTIYKISFVVLLCRKLRQKMKHNEKPLEIF